MDGIKFHVLPDRLSKYEKENRAEQVRIVMKIRSKEEANEIREHDYASIRE